MLHRGAARKVLPAGIVVGVLALALMLPAGAAASAFLAGYGYSYGGNLHSGPSVNPPSGSTTTIFVAGADDAVWTGTVTSGSFSGWTSLLGKVFNRQGSIVTSATAQEVYARGTDSAVWYRILTGTTWGTWTSLGGSVSAGVDVAVFGGNTFVFARGSDSQLWYIKRTGTTWGSWTKIGGVITSAPTAIVIGTSLQVFARGGDNGLWFTSTADGAAYAAFQTVGGQSDSAVAAVSCAAGHENIFVVARDSTLWVNSSVNSGTAWAGWTAASPTGSAWTSDLGATCDTGTITIFGRGLNNALWSWTGITGA